LTKFAAPQALQNFFCGPAPVSSPQREQNLEAGARFFPQREHCVKTTN
jgi:hypothetical protein